MNRRLTKIICGILAMGFAFGFSACGGNKNEVDSSKTQLYIDHYAGGFGSEWINIAKKDFEEKYKDTEFEPGKKGVQVWVDDGKDGGNELIERLNGKRGHIFITESMYYYDYLSKDLLLDISDAVTEPLTDLGENKTIESKLVKSQQDFLSVDKKYYAVPHYFACNGITYDVELFDEYSLFLDEEGNFTKKHDEEGLSVGADGIAGTYDDGLPATFDDFFRLCAEMSEYATPLIWSGQYKFYVDYFLGALAAEINGKNNTEISFTFNGKSDRVITGFDEKGVPLTEEVEINADNAYRVYEQSGYYYALQFIKKIIENNYYAYQSFEEWNSNIETQNTYLLSNRDESLTPIAMLIEGNWWENEAAGTFESMSEMYSKAGRMDRKFAFMPLPKPSADYLNENHTIVESNNSYMFIKKSVDDVHAEVAKKFIRFVNTDEKLREFTKLTNTPKALEYTVDDSTLNAMSYFGKSVLNYKNSKTTDVIYQCSNNPRYYNNMSRFEMSRIYEHGELLHAATAFHDNSSLTLKNFYNGYIANWKTWFENHK